MDILEFPHVAFVAREAWIAAVKDHCRQILDDMAWIDSIDDDHFDQQIQQIDSAMTLIDFRMEQIGECLAALQITKEGQNAHYPYVRDALDSLPHDNQVKVQDYRIKAVKRTGWYDRNHPHTNAPIPGVNRTPHHSRTRTIWS